jgi:hypothetical protein
VVLVLLVLFNLGLIYALLTRTEGGSGGTAPSTAGHVRDSTPTPAATATLSPTRTAVARRSPSGEHLVLDRTALVAEPFRPVAITGAWTGSPTRVYPTVHVEMLRGDRWTAFPLPAVVTRSGRFTAYAALGPSGQYRLRVVGAGGEPVSDPVMVTVR